MTAYLEKARKNLERKTTAKLRKECNMSDFDIARSGWWNVTGALRTCRHLKEDADNVAYYVGNLRDTASDQSVEDAMERSVEALSDAHARVKEALASYRSKRIVREAAE